MEVQGADEARALADVIDVETTVRPGDSVGELRGNWDRVGQVLVTGSDTEAAVATAERLTEKVTVVTTTPSVSHGKTAS